MTLAASLAKHAAGMPDPRRPIRAGTRHSSETKLAPAYHCRFNTALGRRMVAAGPARPGSETWLMRINGFR
jgi:hypothetical protein